MVRMVALLSMVAVLTVAGERSWAQSDEGNPEDFPPAAPPAAPPRKTPDPTTAPRTPRAAPPRTPPGLAPVPPSVAPVTPMAAGPGYRPSSMRKWLFIGVGMNLGFFYPKDVNDYLDALETQQGGDPRDSNILVSFGGHLKVSFRLMEYLRIHVVGDFDFAPSSVTTKGVKLVLLHISPGLELTAHLPLGRRRLSSLFAGVGVLYHWMQLPKHKIEAGTAGFRAMLGWSLYAGRSMVSVALIFDYAKAKTREAVSLGEFYRDPMVLSYTSGMVSVTYHFGVI